MLYRSGYKDVYDANIRRDEQNEKVIFWNFRTSFLKQSRFYRISIHNLKASKWTAQSVSTLRKFDKIIFTFYTSSLHPDNVTQVSIAINGARFPQLYPEEQSEK